jgi:hypothetical protein
VWERAIRLADLLIFACANVHGLDLAHDDVHFGEIATLDH